MSDYAATKLSPVVELKARDQEERFDYTDSDSQEQGDPMLSVAGSPRRSIKPWSFMDNFNPKKQALAIAREIDVKRGIRLELPFKQDIPASNAANEEDTSQSTIRRVPSGAKPQVNGQKLRATTPMDPAASAGNSNEQSIDDVAGQSTPLTLARIGNQGDKDPEENNRNKEARGPSSLNDVLIQKDKELEALRHELSVKDSKLNSVFEERNELKNLLDLSKENRLLDGEANAGIIKDLREEISRKNRTIDELNKRENELEGKFTQQRDKLDETIEGLKEHISREREKAFNELRAADQDWQRKLDEKEAKLLESKDAERTRFQHEISKLQEDYSTKISEIDLLEKKLRDKSDELDKTIKLLEDARKSNDDLKNQSNSTTNRLQQEEKKFQQLVRDLQNSDSSRKELQSEITEVKGKLQAANDRIAELEKGLETAESSQTSLRNDYKRALTRAESFEKTNEQLKNEVKSLTRSHDETKAEYDSVKSRLDEFTTDIEKLKKQLFEAQREQEETARSNEKLQSNIQQERLDHEKAAKNSLKIEDHLCSLTKFVENLTLFGIPIGGLMLHSFEKDHKVTCIDPFFSSQHKDILGFRTKNHDQKLHDTKRLLDSLTIENRRLSSEVDNQWKVKVDTLSQEVSHQTKALADLQSKLRESEDKCEDIQSKYEHCREEIAVMLKEKNDLIREQAVLNESISVLKGGIHNKDQDRIQSLVEKMEKVTHTLAQIREQVKQEIEESATLKSLLKSKERECDELKKLCDEQRIHLEKDQDIQFLLERKERDLDKLQSLNLKQKAELEKLVDDYRRAEGDLSRKITFDVARKSRPDIDKALYDRLMISKVDSIDRVELQNIVKNLILLLEIPFNKLTKKGPLVAIYLKYERPIFLYFANRLHFDLFDEAIDMKRFTNEAYAQYTENRNMDTIKHPLEACLENLYQKLVSRT